MSRLAQAAPARKEALPAKVALAGPAGSGKTYGALLAAEVFAGNGRILVIDTERRSASLYADLAQFDAIDWHPPYDPRELANTLAEAAKTYAVIIIDSLSHFWFGEGGTLDIVDDAGKRARGNSYIGWKEGTPAQEGMYEAILAAPCHVICCLRSKTEYILETDSRGKQVPRKVGMAPVQREGVEYQFTVQLDLDHEHNAMVGKTRCPALSDKVYGKGKTKEWARVLLDWLNSGEAPKPAPLRPVPPIPPEPPKREVDEAVERHPASVDDRLEPAIVPCPRCDFVDTRLDVRKHLIDNHGYVPDSTGKVHPPKPSAPASPPEAGAGPGGEPSESAAPGSPPTNLISDKQKNNLLRLCAKTGRGERQVRLDYVSDTLGRFVPSFRELSKVEAHQLIGALMAEAGEA